ncbi:hypothetical protein ASE73_02540 [Sphingomonas sp. Leaf24]|uniref:hypothetical protein n=1 Tax=unclassified Sphingomonas TaxID=196159 RepID=UPI0007023AEF|nr:MULTISPECIES: hypothetical protein [unclassified Sphingomonas]KQM23121.1 hypothetical protein ASE50_02540 [Sphingomonas sp. Leaf5]KQM95979.1 hypothetical protein ASE73_02540 [Sphingomonas sp. Leaf24]
MALTVLVEARPMRADSGVPVVVHLAGLGSRAYTHANVHDWWAGVVAAPRFTSLLGFGQRGWTGGAIPTTGAITFSPSDRARIDALAGLVWTDAEITIWTGDDALADPVWTTELAGTVAGVTVRDGSMTITVADLSNRLNGPIATGRFAGSGGIEGGAEARERIKRRSFGACWGVEARLIDKAANIYEVGDPARPLSAIDAVKDRGRSGPLTVVGWAGSIVATFEALKTAVAPQDGAAVAPSIACLKWYTQPSAPLTVDLRGEIGTDYVDTVAEIAERIAAEAGLPTVDVSAATAIRPGQAGLHVDGDGETFAQALDRLLLRASLLWLLEPAGAVRLAPIGYATGAPIVEAIEAAREASYKPVTRLVLGYRRNHRVHNDGEISATVPEGGGGTYADGTPIEELRPAQRGADVTGNNTAAALFGQGALATKDTLANGGPHLTGFGDLSRFFGIRFGGESGNFAGLYGEDGTITTDAGYRTLLGTAAGIFGQGLLATLNSLANGSPFLTGFGALSRFTGIRFGGESNGFAGFFDEVGNIATDSGFKTALGIASAIFGQGWGATASEDAASNVRVATGVNMVIDSGFARGLDMFDFVSYVAGTTFGLNLGATGEGFWGKRQVGYIRAPSLTVGQVMDVAPLGRWGQRGNVDNMRRYLLPVAVGDRIAVRALAAPHRCDATLFLLVFDRDGTLLFAPSVSYEADTGGGWLGDGFQSREIIWTCDRSDAAYACIMLRAHATTRDWPDAHLFFSELWQGKLATGQTVLPPYSPGPADAMADRTKDNTAAGIAGQSAWATWSTIAPTLMAARTSNLQDDGNLQAAFVYRPGFGAIASYWPQEAGANITEGRTAAALFGQGALATKDTLANGGPHLTGFGDLSRFFGIRFGGESGNVAGFVDEVGNIATDSGFKTALGVASGIFGQGALATTDTIGSDSQLSGLIGLRLLPYAGDVRYLAASRMAWDVTGGTVQDLKPGEAGANVTEARVAAAIFGQGWGATASEAAASNVRVATGVNMVIDSGFARGLDMFDYAGAAPGLSLGLNLFDAGPGGYWGKRQVAYLHATSLAIGQEMDFAPLGRWGQRGNLENMRRYCTPIALGDRVGVRALAAPHRCDAALFLLVFDREQNLIVAHSSSYPTSVGGGLNGENMQSREIIWTCDYPNAAYFCLMVRGEGTTQAWDDPYLFISEPWQGKLAAGQTVLPPYAPGPADAMADRTKDNTAAGIAGQSAWATWSTIAPTLMAARTSNLQDDGNIQAAYVYRPGFGAIASYWPQEAGANVTEGRTAAALFGQGALATANTIGGDSQLSGEVAQRLAPYAGDGRYLAASRMAWDVTGGTVQQLKPGEAGANVTEGRTAAGFYGQGTFATQSHLSLTNTAYFAADGRFAAASYGAQWFQASNVAWGFGTGGTVQEWKPGEPGANVTETRTAGGIAGQGALATANTIGGDSQLSGEVAQRLSPYAFDGRYLAASRMAWDVTGGTVQQLKPGEAGANVTETRTAGAIAGQSYLATNYPARLGPSPQHGDGYLAAGAVAFAAGETTESLRPGEAGANRTEARTAAAISGQGAFATAPQIGSWNVASYYNFSAFKLDYSITRSDGVSVVTENLAITQYGVAAAIAGQGSFATKSQAGAGDLAAGSVQRIAYTVLPQNIQCAVGN